MTYLGSLPSPAILKKIIKNAVVHAGINEPTHNYAFPVIIRNGVNQSGELVHYMINYSPQPVETIYHFNKGTDIFSKQIIQNDESIEIEAWDLRIVIER